MCPECGQAEGMDTKDPCKDCNRAPCACWDRHLKAARIAARLDTSKVVDNAGYHGVVRKDK